MTNSLTLDHPLYFERLARNEREHWWSAAMWKIASAWLDRALGGRSGLSYLDVGCGAGGAMERVLQRAEFAEVVGTDPSSIALRMARTRSRKIVQSSAFFLPFETDRFDVISCFDVFQHLKRGREIRAALELRRVLRPHGIALVRGNGRGLWPDKSVRPEPYRLRDVVQILREAGFHIERASYVNCLPAVGQELVGKMRGRSSGLHPAGRGLLAHEPNAVRDGLMRMISACEGAIVGKLGARLPTGHSTMVLARMPEGSPAEWQGRGAES